MLVAHTHTYIDKTGEKRKAGRGEKKGDARCRREGTASTEMERFLGVCAFGGFFSLFFAKGGFGRLWVCWRRKLVWTFGEIFSLLLRKES